MTAYAGLLRVAALKEGDVVRVGASSRGLGVRQIAKIKGHKVMARRRPGEGEVPQGDRGRGHRLQGQPNLMGPEEAARIIDVYFENVGGHLKPR